MTIIERCRMLESSLPVAPYRATLTALHDEMLAEIEAKDALLRQALECLERSDTLGWQANLPVIQAIKERLK